MAGGFVIIDDFTDWTTCREAVDRYRAEQRITAPVVLVPHKRNEVVRGAYWRKPREGSKLGKGQPEHSKLGSPPPLCVGDGGHGAVRVPGSYNPSNAVPVGPPASVWSSPATNSWKLEQYVPPAQIYMCTKSEAEEALETIDKPASTAEAQESEVDRRRRQKLQLQSAALRGSSKSVELRTL